MNTREIFLKHLAQTSPSPLLLEITKAEGVWLYDAGGKKIMDLISGIAVSNVGHRHPKVLDAIRKQLDKHLHLMVYGEVIQSPQVHLAEKLSSLLPSSINSFYFVNSGSEAIEGAMKLAKRATGRKNFCSFKNAYHGSTHGAMSLMDDQAYRKVYGPFLPGVSFLRFNHEADLNLITKDTAAVFVELVQGEAGVIKGDKEFIVALDMRCRETGTLLIADEIQTGFGRTGTLFAFEQYGIVPDILCMAKGMGGGMPIGCFAADKALMQCLTENPVLGHITTFGGHPLSCAASLAALEVITSGKLLDEISGKEKMVHEILRHPAIKEIRSAGLLIAVDFADQEKNMRVIENALKKGVFTDWFLFNSGSMRIAPPLIISESELKEGLNKILESL